MSDKSLPADLTERLRRDIDFLLYTLNTIEHETVEMAIANICKSARDAVKTTTVGDAQDRIDRARNFYDGVRQIVHQRMRGDGRYHGRHIDVLGLYACPDIDPDGALDATISIQGLGEMYDFPLHLQVGEPL